jgi:hypothetical protein
MMEWLRTAIFLLVFAILGVGLCHYLLTVGHMARRFWRDDRLAISNRHQKGSLMNWGLVGLRFLDQVYDDVAAAFLLAFLLIWGIVAFR